MANLENNNSENKKLLSEKVEDKLQEAFQQVKNTLEHPLESTKQAAEEVKKLSWWAKLFLWIFGSVFFLFLLILLVLNIPATKDHIAGKVLEVLNKDFGVQISKNQVEVNIFGDVLINGLTIKDDRQQNLIFAKQLRADSDWLSVIQSMAIDKKNRLDFSTLILDSATVNVVTYKGDSIDNFNRFISKFDDGKPRNPNKPIFQLHSRVEIRDSKVSIINQNHEGDEGKWLQADHFNLNVSALHVKGPSVKADINHLTFRTKRWGKSHFVDTFSGKLDVDREHLSLKDLTFYTDHSLLQGDLTFHLDPKTHWRDFNNKVVWDLNLRPKSNISGYDISYFVTKWDNYAPIALSGKMSGALNHFRLHNFVVSGKDVEMHMVAAQFKDLLQKPFHIQTQKISLNITYPALRALMPSFVAQKMKTFADPFGRIQYKGSLDVTPKVVKAKGNAITSIGNAKADVVLSDIDLHEPRYVGLLAIENFNTAAITKNNAVGLITGNFKLDGRGFNVNTLQLSTNSQIKSIEIAGKTIKNLSLNGLLSEKVYNGKISINDQAAKGEVTGKIDFSTKRLFADINADIQSLNLSYFGIPGKEKSVFSGNVAGRIAFTNVNDMNMDTHLKDVVLWAGNQKIEIPDGTAKAFFEEDKRVLAVDVPNVLRGNISGQYNIGDLGKMFQNGFNRVLQGNPEKKYFKGQAFTYVAEVQQKLIDYFLPLLKIPEGAIINGSYNGSTNDLVLNADAKFLKYIILKKEEISQADQLFAKANPDYKPVEPKVIKDSAMVENTYLRINTANPTERININVGRVAYRNNILADVSLLAINEGEELHISSQFKYGILDENAEEKLKPYAVHLNQSVDQHGDYVLRFDPTEMKVNNFVWMVDTSPELNHSITYRKKTGDFVIKNLKLYSEDSQLFIKDAVFKDAKDFTADMEVNQLEISKLLDILPGKKSGLDLKGIAEGHIDLKMDKSNFEPLVDLQVKNITLGGKKLGDMFVSAKNSALPNVYDVNATIASSGFLGKNQLEITGTVDNNAASPSLDLKACLEDFNLGFVQTFVSSIFSNFRGKASGIIDINGPLDNINYAGNIAMKDFGLKVIFNGVDYSFADTTLMLNNGNIILNDPIKISDGRNNSTGTLSSLRLDLSNPSKIGAEAYIRSESLMLLNTEQKDFDLFWGKIYGKGDLFIGFDNNKLSIAAGKDTRENSEPFQILNNSVFTLNSNTHSSDDEFKMLRFLKEDKTGVVSIDEGLKKKVNMDIGLLISVSKGSEVSVLVGDEIGNISVRGNSEKLRFTMKNNKILLDGAYTVEDGKYVSKAILEKTFQIEKGSTIAWDGDAFNPALNIKADYLQTVSNASEYLGIGNVPPINIKLTTTIGQNLKNPKIEFDVLAPEASTQVREALSVKTGYNDEKTLQFGSILVLNNFNTSNTGGFGKVDVSSTGIATGANLLLKQLGNVINTISDQFQIDLNYIKGDNASNTADRANAGVIVNWSPRWKFKSSLGIPISRTTITNNNTFSGQVEYDLSKNNDGSFLVRGYSKPSNIGSVAGLGSNANQSYGVGVVYSRSFKTLFKKNKISKDTLQKTKPIKPNSMKKDSVK